MGVEELTLISTYIFIIVNLYFFLSTRNKVMIIVIIMSEVEFLVKIVNGLQSVTNFAKSFILDVWLGSECVFVQHLAAYCKYRGNRWPQRDSKPHPLSSQCELLIVYCKLINSYLGRYSLVILIYITFSFLILTCYHLYRGHFCSLKVTLSIISFCSE